MKILHPPTTYIAPDVIPERIAPDVVIHPGCRLSGADLSIGPGSEIGKEAPATIINCQLGANVRLAGGFFEQATFLDGFNAGSGAHVRPGCLFEEGSSIAHSVGVKQTVFMPWVTAGSLINFCDVLMAGGTSRKDHSEIGSSYIHFNFTPRGDKATASLIGDVPRGVLLRSERIFLGGQGGIVGPCTIDYGTVIPAGVIWRWNSDLSFSSQRRKGAENFDSENNNPVNPVKKEFASLRLCVSARENQADVVVAKTQRILRANLTYIGNLLALDAWYRVIRAPFMSADPFQRACHQGALQRISEILKERLFRLEEFIERSSKTCEGTLELSHFRTSSVPSEVTAIAERLPKVNYLHAIQSLPDADARILTLWLNERILDVISQKTINCNCAISSNKV